VGTLARPTRPGSLGPSLARRGLKARASDLLKRARDSDSELLRAASPVAPGGLNFCSALGAARRRDPVLAGRRQLIVARVTAGGSAKTRT
jgi:hypothetical protein